jgi:hypothetical protein
MAGLHIRIWSSSLAIANGQTRYFAEMATSDGNACCALSAFNPLTDEMCDLLEPSMDSLPSPDGQWKRAARQSTLVRLCQIVDFTEEITTDRFCGHCTFYAISESQLGLDTSKAGVIPVGITLGRHPKPAIDRHLKTGHHA